MLLPVATVGIVERTFIQRIKELITLVLSSKKNTPQVSQLKKPANN
ncbi:hypothetical protein KR50_28610 [Jeotgalibacillus campisalis]|uniref:Uncharacterized protein n=1 Tax=Jeotgalibacillus campisalis TaxID=220754 RepID=A0A0C2VP09_9BACL|nr:hypothetical protein KR50_28610 [Jeotgalibacillus campisalis]